MGRVALLIAVFLVTGFGDLEAHATDWKFFGGAPHLKDEFGIGFYDAEGIERLSNQNIKVWTTMFTNLSEFHRIEGKKEVIDKAAKKLAKGYQPPYFVIEAKNYTNHETFIDVIAWEETANDADSKPRMKILFEINCREKAIRILSIIQYDKDGMATNESHESAWGSISAGSNAETLHKILCKSKE
ncbi:MAG TPA: surface-adhesin E family protein [Syntrophorhabdaceae bacterium]|nr:surface-adhesin E family protein [Syntrophorhabdaceae bacterium]